MVDYKAKQQLLAKEFDALVKTGDKMQEDLKKITKRMNDLKAQHHILQELIDESNDEGALPIESDDDEPKEDDEDTTPGEGE